MREEVLPGHLVLPHDVLDEKKSEDASFFEGKRYGFLRSFPLFCLELRKAMAEGVSKAGLTMHGKGLYVCTPGPRLETASQVRVYRHHGADLVGQALVPEVFLARELELCYAPLCYASYWAEGIAQRAPTPELLYGGLLSEDEQRDVEQLQRSLPEVFLLMLPSLLETQRECPCPRIMAHYRELGLIGDDFRTWIK
jgi:5'-methylthioadenosine phosphorylase